MYITVEGPLDEYILRKVATHLGVPIFDCYGKRGKGNIKNNLIGYNHAARITKWVVLVDLNDTAECAPALAGEWLPSPNYLLFNVAVREIEAWLLADSRNFSEFLKVPLQRIPPLPENVKNPKEFIVSLARKSQSKVIREDLVPGEGSTARVGPSYNECLKSFVNYNWDISKAAEKSPSLLRLISKLSS
jgi:hypothetical protein